MQLMTTRTGWRFPLMAPAVIALLAGLCAGLLRLGWALPHGPSLAMAHGPLMVCGFLGTLISLERAVALGRPWAYGAPLLTGLGGLALLIGVGGAWTGPLLITAGSGVLVAVFGVLLRQQRERFMQVMTAGAAAWLIGNLWWLSGAAIADVVYWWMGFLVLTIAGERLELSRMLMHDARVERWFVLIVSVFAVGLSVAGVALDAGVRLIGLALPVLALWLVRYDVARHTIRTERLTRFIAACLISGYAWLAVGGLLMFSTGAEVAGPVYDAYLHAVFVGFVFSMIFGHAPIIFPSVLGLPIAYRPFFYVPLVLLHASLLLRLVGDLSGWLWLRPWGGLLNAVAIVLFLGSAVASMIRAVREERRGDGESVRGRMGERVNGRAGEWVSVEMKGEGRSTKVGV